MYAEIEALRKTFAILQTTLAQPCLDPDLVHRIEEIVGTCENGILSLHKHLQEIQDTSANTSKMKIKVKAQLQRVLYPFEESTVIMSYRITSSLL